MERDALLSTRGTAQPRFESGQCLHGCARSSFENRCVCVCVRVLMQTFDKSNPPCRDVKPSWMRSTIMCAIQVSVESQLRTHQHPLNFRGRRLHGHQTVGPCSTVRTLPAPVPSSCPSPRPHSGHGSVRGHRFSGASKGSPSTASRVSMEIRCPSAMKSRAKPRASRPVRRSMRAKRGAARGLSVVKRGGRRSMEALGSKKGPLYGRGF